ncbi:hypothetical protein [Tessaracoccus sp. Z1128]
MISGSGRTAGLVNMAEKANTAGAAVATITTDPAGPIGRIAGSSYLRWVEGESAADEEHP